MSSLFGGFRRLFRWRRHQPTTAPEESTNMEYDHLHPSAIATTQSLPSPILASTPSQWSSPLTPLTSELSGDTSRVRTGPALDDHACSSHISVTSSNPMHQKVQSDEQLLPTEKKLVQKTPNKRAEEGLASKESQKLATTGQPFRERPRVNEQWLLFNEIHRYDGGGLMPTGDKPSRDDSLRKSVIPKTGVKHISADSSMRLSYHTAPAGQSTHASKSPTEKLSYQK